MDERHGPAGRRILLVTALWPTPDRPSVGFVRDRVGAEPGITVIAPDNYRVPTPWRYVKLGLRALVVRGKFDGVEAHPLFPAGLIGLLAARLRGLPLVTYAHGADVRETAVKNPIYRWLAHQVVKGSAAIVTNSSDTAMLVRRLGGEATVIPPGVELSRFPILPRPERRLVLYLGGTDPRKGYRVARTLADTLAGPGIRIVDPREIPALMSAHDVVLVPSVAEPFGLVAAEAIAAGRWVVATAVGGLRDIVEEGVNGTLVADGDHAAAVARVPDYDPATVAATAARFSEELHRRRMAELWDRILRDPRAGEHTQQRAAARDQERDQLYGDRSIVARERGHCNRAAPQSSGTSGAGGHALSGPTDVRFGEGRDVADVRAVHIIKRCGFARDVILNNRASRVDGSVGRRWEVGQAGTRVWIARSWRVLDVGSGHQPHPRADVLLERFPDDDTERAGASVASDARLVVGDAQAMPFADEEFDYVIASHIAEHVADPAALCRELARVARAGYVETPGWLGDMLLRESYHRWRVSRTPGGLRFTQVSDSQPLGKLGEAVYALAYIGTRRPGHRVPAPSGDVGAALAIALRYCFAGFRRVPLVIDAMYTRLEWRSGFTCEVR